MASEDHDIGYLKGKLEGVDTLMSAFSRDVGDIKTLLDNHTKQTLDNIRQFGQDIAKQIEKLATKEEVNILKSDVAMLKKRQEKADRWWLVLMTKSSVWKGIAIVFGLIAMQGIYTLVQMFLERLFN